MITISLLTITTVNVNGLRNVSKRNILFDYLKDRKFDIVLLQETHSDYNDEVLWSRQWEGQISFNHGPNHTKGVAILTSKKSGIDISNVEMDDEGRWIKGEVIWNDNVINLASVYAPNVLRERIYFFDGLTDRITGDKNWIIGGDFNCNLDKSHIKDNSQIILRNVSQEKDLIDVWRTLFPDDPGYTHFHNPTKTPNRIDYFFVSTNMLNQIENISCKVYGLSDHHPITLKLSDGKPSHGYGRWICNNNILNDEDCLFRVKHFWIFWRTQKDKYCNLIEWWEIGKCRLKEIIQDYSKEKSWNSKKELFRLEKRYKQLIDKPTDANYEEIKTIENSIKSYQIKELEKSKIRVRNTIKSEGEKPSKYFLNLESQQIQNNKMDKLMTPEGKYVTQSNDMLKEVNDFYANLYKTENISLPSLNNILNTMCDSSIPEDIFANSENELTVSELKSALFQMNKNKSPGIDGLTVEFYQTYWDIIGYDLFNVLTYSLKMGTMSRSMNTALIRLIYKNVGSKYELKNWRPISLLCVDYKILSKTLTNRLKNIMPFIIGEEQSCGVKSRNIHDNLTIIRDAIDYINWEGLDAAIISIDQEKAFDRINWTYMFAIMDKIGIPPSITRGIKLLYSNPTCRIIVNNFIGSQVQITRGIRQGCPLSPLLFAICAEGLANLFRINNRIKGIEIPDALEKIKLVQHADDTTIFVSDNTDFDVINEILNIYCQGSGSKLNTTKTKGLWLGGWKSRLDKPSSFNWSNTKIKLLGIIFGNDVTPEDNWGPRTNKIQCILDKWANRNLTLAGKAVIVNTFVGCGINYLGSVIPCPREWITKIDHIIWKFYWNGKVDKIKRNTIIGPKDMGGTGLINIECKLKSIKLCWLSKYISSEGKWKYFFNYWINKASGNSKLGWYIFANKCKPVNTAPFYQDLITAFRTEGKIDCSFSSILETQEIPLWHNICVTDDNTELNSPLLSLNNYNSVKDITNNSRLISFRIIARKCNVSNIIAGRIMAQIDNHINFRLIEEKRIGPANHLCNRLVIYDSEIYNTNTKTIYRNSIMSRFIIPKVQTQWQEILNLRPYLDWSSIWKTNLKNTIMDPEDKDFWYKLKHRCLPTMDFVFKIGKTNTNMCPLCKVEPETHEHLFIYCIRTLDAWIYIEYLLRKYTRKNDFYLEDCNRILGYKMKPVHNAIIAKMLRVIWIIRCKLCFNNYSKPIDIDIVLQFK